MSSFVTMSEGDAANLVRIVVRDYLHEISKEAAAQLSAAQRQARKFYTLFVSTLALESPQDQKRVREIYHAAKVDILLRLFAREAFQTVQELARAVCEQFKLLLSSTSFRPKKEPVPPYSREILGIA